MMLICMSGCGDWSGMRELARFGVRVNAVAPGVIVTVGSTLQFTYEVSNTGNTVLNVSVGDDKIATVNCPSVIRM